MFPREFQIQKRADDQVEPDRALLNVRWIYFTITFSSHSVTRYDLRAGRMKNPPSQYNTANTTVLIKMNSVFHKGPLPA